MARQAKAIKDVSPALPTTAEEKLLQKLTRGCCELSEAIDGLHSAIINESHSADALTQASYQRDVIIPAMNAVRAVADDMETMVDKTYWPFPTYADLLFNV